MNNFITIATFNFPHEIIVLKSILENEGILFYFQNENLISINPMATIAYGGINLKINPKDSLIVQNILDNLNSNLEIV